MTEIYGYQDASNQWITCVEIDDDRPVEFYVIGTGFVRDDLSVDFVNDPSSDCRAAAALSNILEVRESTFVSSSRIHIEAKAKGGDTVLCRVKQRVAGSLEYTCGGSLRVAADCSKKSKLQGPSEKYTEDQAQE